jgi:Spy/CpxP family protein refolding chaperone
MKANKTMLIAALAVGSLLVWGPALRAGDTNTPPSTPPAGAPPAGRPPGAGIEREAELLNLTADQKTKVEAIEKAEGQKMVDLRSDTSLTPKDRQAKRKAIAEELSQQMKAVLTPEQFDKWQKTSLMGTRRLHPGGPPPGNVKAGSTNAPVAPPKQ